MIKMTAKDEGDFVLMECEIKGNGMEIVHEMTAILIELPKKLVEMYSNLIHALKINFKHELENLEREGETDGLN